MPPKTDNQELIEKTITTDMLLTGGRLNPAQQDAFIQLVKDTSVLLQKVRFERMATARKQIDKAYIGEPVTRGVAENANTAVNARAVFDQITLNATKVKSDWSITTETLQENIEGDAFEDTLMSMMTKRISTDLEMLAIQGDISIPGGTVLGNLLGTLDGWDKKSLGAHIVDANGSGITKEIFARAMRRMPEQYMQDPDLVWLTPRAVATDWAEQVAARETAAGDDALKGNTLMPYGFPMLVVPNLPARKSLSVATATPALWLGTQFSPFEIIAGSNDKLTINVNAIGNQALTLTAGVYTVVEFINHFMTLLAAASAPSAAALQCYDDGQGRIVFQTVATGAATSIEFVAVANNCYTEIGVTAASHAGAAAGSGTTNDGTILILTNLKNLIFGMVDDTRIYSEYNKDYDRYEFVVYNQLAVEIENTEAMVKVINLKRG